jgi:hypothetical protein
MSTETAETLRWRYTAPGSRSYVDREPDIDLVDRTQPDGNLDRGRLVWRTTPLPLLCLLVDPPIMSWLAPTPPPTSFGNDRLAPQRDRETEA